MLFGGSEGTTFVCDVVGRADGVYIPSMEPLELYRPYMSGVSDALKQRWLEHLYRAPVPHGEVDAWLTGLQELIPGARIVDDRQKAAEAVSVGIKMRTYTLYGGDAPHFVFPGRLGCLAACVRPGWPRLFAFLKRRNVVVVFFRRKNLVKRALSAYRMNREKKSQFTRDRTASVVDPDALLEGIRNYETFLLSLQKLNSVAQRIGVSTLTIDYEDILADKQEVFNRFFRAIGHNPAEEEIERLSGVSRFEKQSSDDLREMIINYDDICARLNDTPYRRFLAGD